jgi:hypothetical protein
MQAAGAQEVKAVIRKQVSCGIAGVEVHVLLPRHFSNLQQPTQCKLHENEMAGSVESAVTT